MIIDTRHFSLLNTVTSTYNQKCQDHKTWSYKFLNFTLYTMESCVLDCELNQSLNQCGCIMPTEPSFLKANWLPKICTSRGISQCPTIQMIHVEISVFQNKILIYILINFEGKSIGNEFMYRKVRNPM